MINKLLKEYLELRILKMKYENFQNYEEATRIRNIERELEIILCDKIRDLTNIVTWCTNIPTNPSIYPNLTDFQKSYLEKQIILENRIRDIDSYCFNVFNTTDPQSIVTQINRELKFNELGI